MDRLHPKVIPVLVAVIACLAAATFAVVGVRPSTPIVGRVAPSVQAHAVDGFSTPTYSPNSDPRITQTENCVPPGPLGKPCMRWVLLDGKFRQGPYSQAQRELPLVDSYCSYTTSGAGGGGYFWVWASNPDAFCTYAGRDHGGHWALDK